jgi:hypothetical protein
MWLEKSQNHDDESFTVCFHVNAIKNHSTTEEALKQGKTLRSG